MARKYTLKRRAAQQAETRRRIVEAAVALHGTVGPARTSFSMVADRAGVQRNTLYAHFPDEANLFQACSAHHLERNPPPDPERWSKIADPRTRLETALADIYAWYERNAELIGCVLRDGEHHAPTREIIRQRVEPIFEAWEFALRTGQETPAEAAMIGLALSFHTWRTLASERDLGTHAAAATMAEAVAPAGAVRPAND